MPGWGGLTTATYSLFERLQSEGFEVRYANLILPESRAPFLEAFGPRYENPRGLQEVYSCTLAPDRRREQPDLAALIQRLAPDLVVAVGSIAAALVARTAPERRRLFLTSGCQQVSRDLPVTEQAPFASTDPATAAILDAEERDAVEGSDLVITHSEMTRALYRHFYPEQRTKIHDEVVWFAEWIHAGARAYSAFARPFDERDAGVLFVANSWARREKNYALVSELAARMDGVSIHVVGEVPWTFPGATFHGLVGDRARLFELMGRARAVASPSLFDAAPGVLFEASAMECNVVASRNCGNWSLCHDALLVERYSVEGFVEKLTLAQTRRFPDHIDRFLGLDSYARLKRVLFEA